MTVEFLDAGREPKCAPDPAYPDGMDIDLTQGFAKTCKFDIPWPAPRCGWMLVVCDTCKTNALLTVAGRPDDPRSVRLPCHTHKG